METVKTLLTRMMSVASKIKYRVATNKQDLFLDYQNMYEQDNFLIIPLKREINTVRGGDFCYFIKSKVKDYDLIVKLKWEDDLYDIDTKKIIIPAFNSQIVKFNLKEERLWKANQVECI